MDTGVGLSSPFTCARVTHQAPALCSYTILASSPVGRRLPSSFGGFHAALWREDRGIVYITAGTGVSCEDRDSLAPTPPTPLL